MPGWEPAALCPGGHVTASPKAAGCKDTLRRGLDTEANVLQSSRTQPEGQGCSGPPIPHTWHLASPPGLSCSSSHRTPCCQPGGNGPVWSCLVLRGGACLGWPPQGPLGTIFSTTSLLLLCLPCDFASSHGLFCAGTQRTSLLSPWSERHLQGYECLVEEPPQP